MQIESDITGIIGGIPSYHIIDIFSTKLNIIYVHYILGLII